MKSLLIGINAKYIHTNLAIRYINKYGLSHDVTTEICSYTINQPLDLILEALLVQGPDVVAFSCYLWNIEMIKKLAVMIKQVHPEVIIIFGGPEVSYDSEELMSNFEAVDYVVAGEGEVAVTSLLKSLEEGSSVSGIQGVVYREDGKVIVNQAGHAMDMAEIPFPYEEGLEGLDNHILYYETSRGCPYSCQYCLSSIEKGVRFRPLDMVKKELQFFLDHKVTQVKFVDRTFNAKISHTLAIWRYLHEHDNGVTNFHFEITADLLDEATIEFLAEVRPGLFQFEVGVQSTNEETIIAVERATNFDVLKKRVMKAMKPGNIHMHLDLIAGLPKEDYKTFAKSFDEVMAIKPEQLQLGFLKVLKGSKIHLLQKSYGIVYRAFAPYEVLQTKELSYEALRRLKAIEELLEAYYNSHKFATAIDYLMACHSSAFKCFECMADYWTINGYFLLPHNKIKMYDLIYEFGCKVEGVDASKLKALLKHDLCLQEKPKKWPEFIQPDEAHKTDVREFYQEEARMATLFENYKGYTSKQISRMAHLECFEFDVVGDGEKKNQWIFYDYKARNVMTGLAKATVVEV